ncbi:DDRGK multi-domain protein [Pyrenophora tritici-repentis]|nr:DDRGK multi-domain protein [Pyrenophora tritici-repentis]KAI0606055.1 DDRGK multi-domain protein [Pyrenophora tritici-repentis]PZD30952.1 DDRGK multi-domain protein [Pyrenophora tritici-repentis]
MLDENLPTFFLKPSTDKLKHHESFYFTQNGTEPEAQYALHHVDPASNTAKNTYAVALFDSRNPEILYGEVLAKPGWSHPTLSQDEIRRNGGVPPPPQPIYPTEFAIQLYNPDTQVIVKHSTAKWSSTVSWEFSLPQVTFRMPSNSDLDRTQTDPGADVNTPRVNFAWRKEGRLGKDMTCYMTGKSTDPTGKKAKRSKEPDIAVAMFSGLRELTILESNLYRVEIEDYKGLEVALLIGAAVIRDLFFSDLNEQFHINSATARKNSGGLRTRKGSSPLDGGPSIIPPVMTPQPPPPPAYTPSSSQYPVEKAPLQPASGAGVNAQVPPPSYSNNNAAKRASLPPLWEIEAETARLKAQVEAEEREQKRQAEAARKARRKQEQEAERKTLQFLEQERKQKELEEKERRRKEAEVDKETERLKKQFGDQSNLMRPSPQPQRQSAPLIQIQAPRPNQRPAPVLAQPARPQAKVSFLQTPPQPRPAASQSSSSFFSNGLPKPVAKAKKSFWGLRTQSCESAEKLMKKKKSSLF